MSPTNTRAVRLVVFPSATVIRIKALASRDSGFLNNSATRIPFIVCMVFLGLILLGVLIWVACLFFIGGAAISGRRRVRACFYSGPEAAPTTAALQNLPSAPKPAVHGQPGPVSALYAPPAGFPVDHGPAYVFARG